MILNIGVEVFGGRYGLKLKNGDIVAVCNVVEYLRQINPEYSNLKFYLLPEAVQQKDYVNKFINFLFNNTDYLSNVPGEKSLGWKYVNLWDFRCISGDLVKIPNSLSMKKKIVVFPLIDADYNEHRNWPMPVFQNILKEFNVEEYDDYEKIICVNSSINLSSDADSWKISTDFETNLNHILTSEIFIGGDTGTNHLAWVLDRSPKRLIYYNSTRGLVHGIPWNAFTGKGEIRSYWLDMEGTQWN
jgi:hypothetical protein